MSLVEMPGRRAEDTYRNSLKHIIVSSKVLQTLSSFPYDGREGMKIGFPAPQSLTLLHWFEMCIDFGALVHRFGNTVRAIINGTAAELLYMMLFLYLISVSYT